MAAPSTRNIVPLLPAGGGGGALPWLFRPHTTTFGDEYAEGYMIINTAGQKVGAQMITAADGSNFSGSVTVYVTIDAGTQAIGSVGGGACTSEGQGYYTYAPAQAETNGALIAFTFIGTGAVTETVQAYTRAATPDVNTASISANAITATAIAANALTAAKIATDAIGAAQLASDAVAEIADGVWDEATAGHVGAGSFGAAVGDILTDTAVIGVAGAGLTAVPWNAAWDAEVQSEVADALTAFWTSPATLVDLVWDEPLAGHAGAGTTGEALSNASSAGDPWSTALPGAYGAGTAGQILGDNLDVVVSTRASQSSVDTIDSEVGVIDGIVDQILVDTDTTIPGLIAALPTAATNADAVWDEATAGHAGAGTYGLAVSDILVDTAQIGVAGAGLSAIPWNAAWDAEVQSEVTDALVAYDPPTKAELDAAVAPLALEATLGTPAGASISADIAVIESQTDDIGVAGAGLTAVPWNASWDAEVQSEVNDGLVAFWTSPATLVDLVWDEPTAGHTTTGTTGKALIDAGSAGDPWSTALPGAYGAGTAGQIIGDNLDVVVSTRASQTSVDDLPTNAELATALDALPTAAENADAVWDEATAGHASAGTYGLAVSDILTDTAVIGAAGAGLAAIPWNAAWDTEVQSEVTDALVAYDPPTEAEMNARTLAAASYATATALQTVDNEVAALQTSINDVPTVAEFEARTIVAANYATASALATVDSEVGVIDGIVDAIKLKTDLIPAAPAAVGDIPTAVQNADALLGRTISGGANGGRDVTSALRQLRNKQVIAAGTLTVYQEDDVTSAWTAAITTAAGDPISEMDPV